MVPASSRRFVAESGGISAASMLRAFRHRWRLALSVGLLLALPGIVLTLLLVPGKYTAVALVQVSSKPPRVLDKDEHVAEADRIGYQKTQVALVTSRTVLNEAVKNEAVRGIQSLQKLPDPAAWLEGEIKAGFIEDSDLMRVGINGANPEEAATLVNAVLDAYMAKVAEGERAALSRKARELDKLYLEAKEELSTQKDNLEKLAKNLSTIDPQVLTIKQRNAIEDLQEHKRYRATLENQKLNADLIFKRLKNQMKGIAGESSVFAELENRLNGDAELISMQKSLEEKRKAYGLMESRTQPGNPTRDQMERDLNKSEEDYKAKRETRRSELTKLLRKDIEPKNETAFNSTELEIRLNADAELISMQKSLEEKRREFGLVESRTQPGNPTRDRLERDLKKSEEDHKAKRETKRAELTKVLRKDIELKNEAALHTAQEELRALTDAVESLKVEEKKLRQVAETLGTSSFEVEMKRFEFEQAQNQLKSLLQEMDRLQLELRYDKQRITALQRAEPPRIKNNKERLLATTFAGLTLFLIGACLVSYRELSNSKIYDAEAMVQDLEIKLIGTLPLVPDVPVNFMGKGAAEQLLAESISYIRTRILAHFEGKSPQAIMISSASPKEGKTFLAAHLAGSLAEAGRRTLLVDGDLRRPSIGGLFDVSQSPGLCDALRGDIDVRAAVSPTSTDGLSVLTAGECCPTALRKLTQARVEELFCALRAEYDCIIVDSSPLIAVADSLLLGKHMDGVIVCVRQQVSRGPAVFAALERLRDLRLPILGIVVNGVRLSTRSDSYRYLLFAKN
jgi:capsular exopolysaccharide synthesis family protein